jgi:DNA-binding transcriptional LysR family regulator
VLAEVRPHALLPPGHPLAAQEAVALADLAREPFILVDLPVSRELLMAPFWERGLSPRVLLRTGSVEMVRSMVANGLGVSLLFTRPRSEVTPDGRPVLTRPLRDEVASQRLVAASMGAPGDGAVLAEAVAAIRAHAEGALTGPGRS